MNLIYTFDLVLVGLLILLVGLRAAMYFRRGQVGAKADSNNEKMKSIHYKFLAVFWTFRFSDWLQGPYFYEVYASKTYEDGTPFSSMTIAILFLCGFISSGVCGAFVGTLVDRFGRKAGCVAFCVIYSLSALSTTSNSLFVLVMGRVLGGIATSLLESAPESWFVRQHELENAPGHLMGTSLSLSPPFFFYHQTYTPTHARA